MNILLNRKTVKINNFEREVALKIEGNKMFGVLNKTRFVWIYTEHELPNVETKEGVDKLKAAKYGRLYILKRLEMEGVKLNIKTKERTVDYIHIPEENGVWCNVFENGYIRGCVNGAAFTWNPAMYKMAVAVNEAGFNGTITQKIDTDKIKARLKAAGYTSYNNLMKAFDKTKGSANVDPFSISKDSSPTPSDKFIVIENTESMIVKYHENGFISGSVNDKEFAWDGKDVSFLMPEVRKTLKCFGSMKYLKEYFDGIFDKSYSLINEISFLFKEYKDLQETYGYIHEGLRTPEDIMAILQNCMDYMEEIDENSSSIEPVRAAINLTSKHITSKDQVAMGAV